MKVWTTNHSISNKVGQSVSIVSSRLTLWVTVFRCKSILNFFFVFGRGRKTTVIGNTFEFCLGTYIFLVRGCLELVEFRYVLSGEGREFCHECKVLLRPWHCLHPYCLLDLKGLSRGKSGPRGPLSLPWWSFFPTRLVQTPDKEHVMLLFCLPFHLREPFNTRVGSCVWSKTEVIGRKFWFL